MKKLKCEDIKMESKRQKRKEARARLMATILVGLMIFSVVAGVLIYFVKQ